MRYLLDTHTALWFVNEHEKLSPETKEILLDDTRAFYISVASAWEIAIKASIGKLTEFKGGVKVFLAKIEYSPINILTVTPEHIEIVETLPFHHRDPFDRLLISTAFAENLTIITADENIQKYDVKWIW
jgi:PIN domain nuclease of toxin-antitoxin system